jgi:mono/diheme cytochrome c family protein
VFTDLANRTIVVIVAVVIVVAAAGLYFMSTSLGPNGGSITPTEIATSPKSVQGEVLYADYCAGCHGAKGVGDVGPPLSSNNVNRSIIENGNIDEGMPSFKGELNQEEISSIIDYLSS